MELNRTLIVEMLLEKYLTSRKFIDKDNINTISHFHALKALSKYEIKYNKIPQFPLVPNNLSSMYVIEFDLSKFYSKIPLHAIEELFDGDLIIEPFTLFFRNGYNVLNALPFYTLHQLTKLFDNINTLVSIYNQHFMQVKFEKPEDESIIFIGNTNIKHYIRNDFSHDIPLGQIYVLTQNKNEKMVNFVLEHIRDKLQDYTLYYPYPVFDKIFINTIKSNTDLQLVVEEKVRLTTHVDILKKIDTFEYNDVIWGQCKFFAKQDLTKLIGLKILPNNTLFRRYFKMKNTNLNSTILVIIHDQNENVIYGIECVSHTIPLYEELIPSVAIPPEIDRKKGIYRITQRLLYINPLQTIWITNFTFAPALGNTIGLRKDYKFKTVTLEAIKTYLSNFKISIAEEKLILQHQSKDIALVRIKTQRQLNFYIFKSAIPVEFNLQKTFKYCLAKINAEKFKDIAIIHEMLTMCSYPINPLSTQ